MLTRRKMLKLGLGGASLLLSGGCATTPTLPIAPSSTATTVPSTMPGLTPAGINPVPSVAATPTLLAGSQCPGCGMANGGQMSGSGMTDGMNAAPSMGSMGTGTPTNGTPMPNGMGSMGGGMMNGTPVPNGTLMPNGMGNMSGGMMNGQGMMNGTPMPSGMGRMGGGMMNGQGMMNSQSGMCGMMGGNMMLAGSSPATTAFQVPLPIPPVLKPQVKMDQATGKPYDYYEVTIKAAQQQILPGLSTTIWGYNGQFPGPTIVGHSGRNTVVKFTNNLSDNQVVHLHGGHVPVEMDGHAMDYILPGGSREYVYPNNQIAATLLYHDHTMDFTGLHVYKGLAGFYVITDEVEDKLPLPKGDQDIGLVIQDRLFNGDGSLNYTVTMHSVMMGYHGDVILVNGAVQPFLKVAGRKYRFRIANGSNARLYELALSSGKPFIQIGTDGGLLPAPVTRPSLTIAPGERIEVVVDFAEYGEGTQVILKNLSGSGTMTDVMRFDVGAKENDPSSVPASLRPFTPIPASQAVKTRSWTLGMRMGKLTINGLSYDGARVDADPALNSTEIWEIVNPTCMSHPMHAHAIQWQILDRNGAPPPAYEVGWKDVWLVHPGEKVRVIGTFADYACDADPMKMLSTYMLHCHILEHDDNGMMAQFKVIDAESNKM